MVAFRCLLMTLDQAYYSSLTIYSHPLWHDIKLWFLANWAQMYCCQISRTRNTCLYFSFVTTLYKITQSWRTVRAHNTGNCNITCAEGRVFPLIFGFSQPSLSRPSGQAQINWTRHPSVEEYARYLVLILSSADREGRYVHLIVKSGAATTGNKSHLCCNIT